MQMLAEHVNCIVCASGAAATGYDAIAATNSVGVMPEVGPNAQNALPNNSLGNGQAK